MKKTILLLIFYSAFVHSQSATNFLINDIDKFSQKQMLPLIITESKKYGYEFIRTKEGEFIYKGKDSNQISLTKSIYDYNLEGFPVYSIGHICKTYFFFGDDINKALIWKINTEIILSKYSNVSINQILNTYYRIQEQINKSIKKENFKVSQTIDKFNQESYFGNKYDVVKEITFSKPCPFSSDDCKQEYILSIGQTKESKTDNDGSISDHFYLDFTIKDSEIAKFNDKVNKLIVDSNRSFNNSFDKIRFSVKGQDMREINQYDLEAMVRFFIHDCEKNNIKIPEIKKITSTFEVLQGSTIALAYGYNNDDEVIIKVDPAKWANCPIEKRWYVLYHELGHDVLNLDHGQGGKMMFNFAERDYTWDEFFNDKEYMFNFNKF
ncbi:hypothetical protein [Flavobacterium sp. ZS1P14]|uniref:hypothetical protein n=1 Tax=Flavobacterium sp. ZS1P14 TaxID=3401729 RepID=UPI003AAC04F1